MKKFIINLINTIIGIIIFWGLFVGIHLFIAFIMDKINLYVLTFIIIPSLVMLCAVVD